MRFYRAGGINIFPDDDYHEVLFFHQYNWDKLFGVNTANSLGHLPAATSCRHTEALLSEPEVFGYGLAVLAASKLFKITTDRFFFLLGKDEFKRPDFAARVTEKELTNGGTVLGFLAKGGQRILLEVKVRRNGAKNPKNIIPVATLQDIDQKAAQKGSGLYIGICISIPSPELWPSGITRILIADPGKPEIVSENEQANILLHELFFLGYRTGLWNTATNILEWISALGFPLSNSETGFLSLARSSSRTDELNLRREDDLGRTFLGRHFVRALEFSSRFVDTIEIERILKTKDFGPSTFRGIDIKMIKIIEERDLRRLLSYGASDEDDQIDLSSRSAYIELDEPLTPAMIEHIEIELSNKLSPMEAEEIDLSAEDNGF